MLEEEDWVGDKACMRMKGRCMTGEGIADGDFCILQRNIPYKVGSIVAYSGPKDAEEVRIGKIESIRGNIVWVYYRIDDLPKVYADIQRERIIAVFLGIVRMC